MADDNPQTQEAPQGTEQKPQTYSEREVCQNQRSAFGLGSAIAISMGMVVGSLIGYTGGCRSGRVQSVDVRGSNAYVCQRSREIIQLAEIESNHFVNVKDIEMKTEAGDQALAQ